MAVRKKEPATLLIVGGLDGPVLELNEDACARLRCEKKLVIALMSSPTNLDGRVGSDNASSRMFDLIYSGLIKVTTNFDYAPDLATKWEMPDDKTIVFHLNPNAKFHNGQPVKAADVKWTYESMMNPSFTTSRQSKLALRHPSVQRSFPG